MKLDLNLTFPKTLPSSRAEVVARVGELKRTLSLVPVWMVPSDGRTPWMVGLSVPRQSDAPSVFKRQDGHAFHNFTAEKNLSSRVRLEPAFVVPKASTGIEIFQVFSKIKERKDVMLVWEFLMLDLWSHVMRYYTQVGQVCLGAPQSFRLEGDALLMAFQLGTIGNKLCHDYAACYRVKLLTGTELPLYYAFALHLGALAAVKEAEELLHGDCKLRHVIFDPGEQVHNFIHFVLVGRRFIRGLGGMFVPPVVSIKPFLSAPSLSVIDIEHGLRAPRPKVREENDRMLVLAREQVVSQGLSPRQFEQAVRDGYDMITPQNVTQRFVDAQYERWGFSVDNLF